MRFKLFVQCPQCSQYFAHEQTHTDDRGTCSLPLHSCFIGAERVENTLVQVIFDPELAGGARIDYTLGQGVNDAARAEVSEEPF